MLGRRQKRQRLLPFLTWMTGEMGSNKRGEEQVWKQVEDEEFHFLS